MRYALLAAALVCAAAPPALAAPAPADPKLAPEVRAKYAPALSRGRKLEGKHDWKAAIAAFDECLAVLPDDPVALSEIGWSAYNVPDLARAEKSTQAALKAGGSKDLRGATLYNLGLIKEAQGDKAGAIAAYRDSLKERPNETVRGQLGKLDPAAAKELDPFKPVEMNGPFKILEAFCKEEHPPSSTPETDDDPGEKCECSAHAIDAGKLDKARGPIKEARIFSYQCSSGRGSYERIQGTLVLGVRVAAGWFVRDLVDTRDDHYCSDEIKGPQFAIVEAAPGAAPALTLRIGIDEGCARSLMNETTTESFYVAGVGPSGHPSLTPAVTTVDEFSEMKRDAEGNIDWDSGEYVTKRDIKRKAAFTAGKLVIGGSKRTPGAEHELVFP
jgi:hypothetical protein